MEIVLEFGNDMDGRPHGNYPETTLGEVLEVPIKCVPTFNGINDWHYANIQRVREQAGFQMMLMKSGSDLGPISTVKEFLRGLRTGCQYR